MAAESASVSHNQTVAGQASKARIHVPIDDINARHMSDLLARELANFAGSLPPVRVEHETSSPTLPALSSEDGSFSSEAFT